VIFADLDSTIVLAFLVRYRTPQSARVRVPGAGFGAGSASNWGMLGHGTTTARPRPSVGLVVLHRDRAQ